jgi:hypothetical protein
MTIHKGTTDDPVRRDDRCAVRDCAHHGTMLRITRGGQVVLYCPGHYNEAHRRFDRKVTA